MPRSVDGTSKGQEAVGSSSCMPDFFRRPPTIDVQPPSTTPLEADKP